MNLPLAVTGHFFAALLIPANIFWPYFAGAVVLAIGLAQIARSKNLEPPGIDKLIVFGPLFIAIPMAVFGAFHFIAAKLVAPIVPKWIPGHLFWVYFVGAALIAAGLSLASGKSAKLAAALLSAMLFSFVLLIHLPNLVKFPHNRIVFAVFLRDTSFSAGALACAFAVGAASAKSNSRGAALLFRSVIGICTVLFGVMHFRYPDVVPVIPLVAAMPSWVPAHVAVSYLIGAAMVACGLCLIFNWKARAAATWMGILVFVVVMVIYLPMMIVKFFNIEDGLNYFADTLVLSGVGLSLAGMLPVEQRAEAALENRGASAQAATVSEP